jgi:catechol 2,3-dioxygenase-like lactoylglutathione lyase family enzyme
MTIQRMDHVGVVVDDLAAAKAFFVELGLRLDGEAPVEGSDRIIGLHGVRADIAFLRTPDGHGAIELTKFHSPTATSAEPNAPANTPGLRHLTFAVDDLDDVLARLRDHGAELVGEVEQFGDTYRLCFIRGPEGIIIELAEQVG